MRVGIELMHMIQKKQLVVEAGEEGLTAADVFSALAASSPLPTESTHLHSSPHKNMRQSCHAPQGHHDSCKWALQDRNL